MDPKSDAGRMFLAPHSHNSAVESYAPQTRTERRPTPFPPVDEHIVQPEVTYDEIIRGRKVTALTALHPHAEAQNTLAFLIAPHVKPGYRALTELLTRASANSDFGTDVCVCREGTDPETGSRYLEEISFEVVNEQRMRDITEKAEDLVHRGVRRVFAIFVKKGEAREWSRTEGKFVPLNENGMIEDSLFIRPIAVKALIDFALSEDEVARALIVKGNAAIEAFKQEVHKLGVKLGVDEGQLKGRRETLIEQLGDRFGHVPAQIEARVRIANPAQLRAWSKNLLFAASLEDVFVSD